MVLEAGSCPEAPGPEASPWATRVVGRRGQAVHVTSLRLRRLQRADVAVARALAERAFGSSDVGDDVQVVLEAYCRRGLADQRLTEQPDEALPREYYVVELGDGDVVAITGLYRLGTWTARENLWLGWTAVDAHQQGRGIGTALLADVVDLARERGAERLKVETELGGRATAFYVRNGFVEEARLRAHYAGNLDAVVLTRDL